MHSVCHVTHFYDSGRGALRGNRVWGTNLAGGSSHRESRGTGKFSFDGDESKMWSVGAFSRNGVLACAARDYLSGIMPPISFYHNRGTTQGFLLKIDFDAKDTIAYTRDQLFRLAQICIKGYQMCCPTHWSNDDARGDDPLAILSLQDTMKVSVNFRCNHCQHVLQDIGDACPSCKQPIQFDALEQVKTYKNGFHLHGIQYRDVTGQEVDANKSAPIFTTYQHLVAREIILSLWEDGQNTA